MDDTTNSLRARITAKRNEIAEASAFRESLVEALASAKTAKAQSEAERSLDKADEELTALRRRLADLERALQIAEQRDSRAKELQKFELTKHQRTRVDELGDLLDAEVEKLIVHIDGLRPILANLDAIARDRVDAAYSVVRECARDPQREWNEVYGSALTGQNYRGVLVDALYASGIGRVGINLAPFLDVVPTRNNQTAAEIRDRDRNAIARRLGKLLKAREAQINEAAKGEA